MHVTLERSAGLPNPIVYITVLPIFEGPQLLYHQNSTLKASPRYS
jgi:hypothetical protein